MIGLSLRLGMAAFVLLVDLNCAAVAQDKLRIAGGLAGDMGEFLFGAGAKCWSE